MAAPWLKYQSGSAPAAEPVMRAGAPLDITVDSYRGAPQPKPGPWAKYGGGQSITRAQFADRWEAGANEAPDPAQSLLQDYERGMSAGVQKTSPIVRNIKGELNYQPVGEGTLGDDGNVYVKGTDGLARPTDSATQVALTDPSTGKLMIYERAPNMNEGTLSALGHIALPGLASTAPEGMAVRAGANAARAGEAIPEAVAAAETGPAAGSRLSSGQIVAAFDRAGIEPTLPTALRNRGVGGMAQMLNNSVAGTPISRSFANQADQAAARAEQIATGMGSDVGQASIAGERLQQGAETFRKVTAPARQSDLYGRVSTLLDATQRSPLPSTRRAVKLVSDMIENPDVRKLVTDKNFASLAATIAKAGRAGLSFDDLRQLRTQVRLLRPAEGSAVGINKVAVNKLYDGLTMDMYALAQKAGGDTAVHALRRADQYTRALETVRAPALEQMLSAKSGENAFAGVMKLAQDGAGADWRKLVQIRRSVGDEAWSDLSATVLRQMGNPRPGAMSSVDMDQFSPATFMTNFNKLSTKGKAVLFGERGSDLRNALDDLTIAVGEMKRVAGLGNPSGTGRQTTALSTLYGLFAAPVPTVAALATGHGLSMLMVNPKFVRWATSAVKAEQQAMRGNKKPIAALLKQLPGIAGQDQFMIDAVRQIEQAISGEAGAATGRPTQAPADQRRSGPASQGSATPLIQ